MSYKVIISPFANDEIQDFKKDEPYAYKKVMTLIGELQDNPKIGTGHPKPLSGNRVGQWSRKVTDKHRLVYKIQEEMLTVVVASVHGHYGDK
jgi:toxin YoeB